MIMRHGPTIAHLIVVPWISQAGRPMEGDIRATHCRYDKHHSEKR